MDYIFLNLNQLTYNFSLPLLPSFKSYPHPMTDITFKILDFS